MKTLESREMRNTMEQDKPKKQRKKIAITRRLSQRKYGSAGRNIYLDKDEFKDEIAKWR